MDIKAVTEHIRRILTAPDVDLATISSKKVRKVLAESFGASVVKENKEAIDALIIEAFNRIATAAGATTAVAPPSEPQHTTSTTTVKTEGNGFASSSSHHTANNANTNAESSSKQRDRQKQQQPEESEASDEEEDASASESDVTPQKKTKKPSPTNLKSSPQKRKIEAVASDSFPASSPNVPLSMTTGLTDEEYARKLQEEFNNMAGLGGGRSTRGSGSRSNATKKKKSSSKRSKAESSNGSSSKKYRSKAYIDDSDLEGEEGHNRNGSNDDSGDAAPKKKKRKAPASGGGYNKELALSEPLQKVCGVPTMSRPKIVKRLWEYIREHELQDPNKRSDIINDDLFKEIFGVEKMTMFSMNKYLVKSVSPINE